MYQYDYNSIDKFDLYYNTTDQLQSYLKKNYFNRLYNTQPYIIGEEGFDEIKLRTQMTKVISKNGEAIRQFFGFAITLKDKITKKFNFGTINQNIDSSSIKYIDGADYSLQIVFDYSFTVENFMTDFYSSLDKLAKVGGLWAAFKIIVAICGPIFVFIFMFSFARVIQRKSEQNLRVFKIKEILKNLPKIRAAIKKKNDEEDDEKYATECMEALRVIDDDSKEMLDVKRIIAQAKRSTTTKRNFEVKEGQIFGTLKKATKIVSYERTEEVLCILEKI